MVNGYNDRSNLIHCFFYKWVYFVTGGYIISCLRELSIPSLELFTFCYLMTERGIHQRIVYHLWVRYVVVCADVYTIHYIRMDKVMIRIT